MWLSNGSDRWLGGAMRDCWDFNPLQISHNPQWNVSTHFYRPNNSYLSRNINTVTKYYIEIDQTRLNPVNKRPHGLKNKARNHGGIANASLSHNGVWKILKEQYSIWSTWIFHFSKKVYLYKRYNTCNSHKDIWQFSYRNYFITLCLA